MNRSGPFLAVFMTGAYERSRAAGKRSYERTYEEHFLLRSKKAGPNALLLRVNAGERAGGHFPLSPPCGKGARPVRPVSSEENTKNLRMLAQVLPATRKGVSAQFHTNRARSALHQLEVAATCSGLLARRNRFLGLNTRTPLIHVVSQPFAAQLVPVWPKGKRKTGQTREVMKELMKSAPSLEPSSL